MRIVSCGNGSGYIYGSLMIIVNKAGRFVDARILDSEKEDSEIEHGTYAGYRKKCRCDLCTKANTAYLKAYRERTGRKK